MCGNVRDWFNELLFLCYDTFICFGNTCTSVSLYIAAALSFLRNVNILMCFRIMKDNTSFRSYNPENR